MRHPTEAKTSVQKAGNPHETSPFGQLPGETKKKKIKCSTNTTSISLSSHALPASTRQCCKKKKKRLSPFTPQPQLQTIRGLLRSCARIWARGEVWRQKMKKKNERIRTYTSPVSFKKNTELKLAQPFFFPFAFFFKKRKNPVFQEREWKPKQLVRKQKPPPPHSEHHTVCASELKLCIK